ncbi:DUF883 family protein [Nitrosococcus watsonii]|uniref:DUF883 domain-containing protein n=1 Tax=Nitrosococcus watsoni (strain C-113) TaxID=105559 RepID=D8K6K6_NITWC|nr:DUF883 family protein [Nitrosococcus watsonii]ADJ28533.1 protein of unknown function DUF883 ElaB [Nitrosococcus watsonii C-113]
MADNSPKKEVDELKDELSQLRKDMGSVVSAVKNLGQSTARTTKTKAEQELDEMLEKLNRAYLSAREGGERAVISTYSEIERHPLASLGVAFVAGLIAGKLFSQK